MNIILRANIIDEGVNVQYKVLPLPLENNTVELLISPVSGYTIISDDFSHGLLPTQITSMSFVQVGPNVVASVQVSDTINNSVTQNISLPIIIESKLNIDIFKINSIVKEIKNTTSQTLSSFPTSIDVDRQVHTITNQLGNKVLVLSKTIVAINGYYFDHEPNYNITGNHERYSVTSDIIRGVNNKIIRKTFNVYYTSPLDLKSVGEDDNIEFFASTYKEQARPSAKVAKSKDDYDIYSFDKGRQIGIQGGIKIMKIRGVPGTEFKLMIHDSLKKTYNFASGVFEAGGGMLIDKIPSIIGDSAYGEYIIAAKIPKSSTNQSIQVTLNTDKVIDHQALQVALNPELNPASSSDIVSTSIQSILPSTQVIGKEVQQVVTEQEGVIASVMTFLFGNSESTYTVDKIEFQKNGVNNSSTTSVISDKAEYKKKSSDIEFTALLRPTDRSKGIQIVRQPLHSSKDAFVNWDSGSGKATALTSGGVSITNDWFMSVADVAAAPMFEITTRVFGVGEPLTSDDLFTFIQIEGRITGITHGKGDITAKLDLTNFTTLGSL